MDEADYKAVSAQSRQSVTEALLTGDVEKCVDALLSTAMHESYEYALELCIRFTSDPNDEIRGAAVLSLGHIARIHGKIDHEKVDPLLKTARGDPSFFVRAQADCAWDDIRRFATRSS